MNAIWILRKTGAAMLVAVCLVAHNPSHAASYCDSFSEPALNTVCSYGNGNLTRLDIELEESFHFIYNSLHGNEQERFREDQNAWIERRNQCDNDDRCLNTLYRNRKEQLRKIQEKIYRSLGQRWSRRLSFIEGFDYLQMPLLPLASQGSLVRVAHDMRHANQNGLSGFDIEKPTYIVEILGATKAKYANHYWNRHGGNYEKTEFPKASIGPYAVDILLGMYPRDEDQRFSSPRRYPSELTYVVGRIKQSRRLMIEGFPVGAPTGFEFDRSAEGQVIAFPIHHIITDRDFRDELASIIARARNSSLAPAVAALGVTAFIGASALVRTICEDGCDLGLTASVGRSPYVVLEQKLRGGGQKYAKIRCRSGQTKTIYANDELTEWRSGLNIMFPSKTLESAARSACP